jgi:predicted CopG family antitoxin
MVKTITIKDTTYRNLAALKGRDESFSELLDRLAARQGLAVLERLRGSISAEDKEGMLADIAAKRGERRFA